MKKLILSLALTTVVSAFATDKDPYAEYGGEISLWPKDPGLFLFVNAQTKLADEKLAKPITLDGYTIRPPKVKLLKAERCLQRMGPKPAKMVHRLQREVRHQKMSLAWEKAAWKREETLIPAVFWRKRFSRSGLYFPTKKRKIVKVKINQLLKKNMLQRGHYN